MRAPSAVIDALERAPQIVVPVVREVPPALLKRLGIYKRATVRYV
jgi:hypothetical protein